MPPGVSSILSLDSETSGVNMFLREEPSRRFAISFSMAYTFIMIFLIPRPLAAGSFVKIHFFRMDQSTESGS
jgi:hypothetical protein